MEDEYYKIDLHIHTPASIKCYEGSKSEDEYLSILQNAHEKNLDIIAITDHNTIAGYNKMIDIKKKLESKVELLEEFKDDSIRVKESIDDIKCKLELYKKIVILPGVEITLNPGIHMLVISDFSNKEELNELLEQIGYTDEKNLDSECSIKTDIKVFLENPLLNNKLVIAPHIDSKNGIYNDIKRGSYRADIFKSPVIDAMTCNSISQLNNIKNLLKTDDNYKRECPIAFINASDAHRAEDIGSKISYVKLKNKNIESLKNAFDEPEENVSDTSNQNLAKTIKGILENKDSFVIQNIDKEEPDFLTKRICACLNENYDYILLGVSLKSYELYGINMDEEELTKYIKESIDDIDSRFGRLRYNSSVESMGNGRQIGIIILKPEIYNLWYTSKNKEVYLTSNDSIRFATIEEIESMVVENTLHELQRIEEKRDESVNALMLRMKTLKFTTKKFEIIQNIDIYSYPILYVMDITHNEPYPKVAALISENLKRSNGDSEGNIFFINKIDFRLNDSILRYSCPVLQIDDALCTDIPTYSGDKIIICENGGTYFISQDLYRVTGISSSYIDLGIKEEFVDDYSIFGIIGWLKSSVLLWYTLTKSQSANLYIPDVLRNIPVPHLECLKPGSVVETNVKKIFDIEHNFLIEFNEEDICNMCKMNNADCEIVCPINKSLSIHNKKISEIAREIDIIIMDELEIDNEKVIELMRNEIEASQYFNIL
jgi:hypothetical protein